MARNQYFAMRGGLEPKVKTFSQYVLNWGGVVSRLVQLKRITDGGEAVRSQVAGRFFYQQ